MLWFKTFIGLKILNQFDFCFSCLRIIYGNNLRQKKIKLNWFENSQTKEKVEPQLLKLINNSR